MLSAVDEPGSGAALVSAADMLGADGVDLEATGDGERPVLDWINS